MEMVNKIHTFNKMVINMIVMRTKNNDLTNHAVQCNQFGNPIIFIDS